MVDEVNQHIAKAKTLMEESIEHLNRELLKVRTGKASPSLVNSLMVSYYGSPTPMNQIGNISTSDSRTLIIQPWEKSLIPEIEKAIFEANLGVTPQNDGEIVRISIPMLTEDRRKELVKTAKAFGEDAKVAIRNVRRDLVDKIRKAGKDGLPEDMTKQKEGEAQDLTNSFTDKVDKTIKTKEEDILTI